MADPYANLHKDPVMLSQVFAALTNPDTNAIKAAEDVLRPFLKKASCVKAIVQQAAECPNAAVRQVAAVVLRKPIGKLWKKIKPEVQVSIKQMLIAAMMRETERPVRHQIASLAAALAKLTGFKPVTSGKKKSDKTAGWTELLQMINGCASAADAPAHRELAYYLLAQVGVPRARPRAAAPPRDADLARAPRARARSSPRRSATSSSSTSRSSPRSSRTRSPTPTARCRRRR